MLFIKCRSFLQSAKAPKNKDKKGKSKEPEVKKKPLGSIFCCVSTHNFLLNLF